jgi:hypothetical protein
MKLSVLFILLIFVFTSSLSLFAQNSDFSKDCEEYMKLPYISDGHDYNIEIKQDEKGEFKTTFYGGSSYRIITCSNLPQGKVLFTIYDTEKNILFDNKDYNYTNYWDFTFRSTIDCTIEIRFESEVAKNAKVKLMIGFKNQ